MRGVISAGLRGLKTSSGFEFIGIFAATDGVEQMMHIQIFGLRCN